MGYRIGDICLWSSFDCPICLAPRHLPGLRPRERRLAFLPWLFGRGRCRACEVEGNKNPAATLVHQGPGIHQALSANPNAPRSSSVGPFGERAADRRTGDDRQRHTGDSKKVRSEPRSQRTNSRDRSRADARCHRGPAPRPRTLAVEVQRKVHDRRTSVRVSSAMPLDDPQRAA